MIQATVTKVLFAYDLENRREEPDCAVLRLPNGMELRAPIGHEHMNYFNEYLAQEQYRDTMRKAGQDPDNIGYSTLPAEPPGSPTEVEPVDVEAPTEESPKTETTKQDPTVVWADLPSSILSDNVKVAMRAIGDLPDELQLSLVTQIRDKINEDFSAEDWTKAGVGQVNMPAVAASGSASRVMVDAGGNPVPQDDDHDPGEQVAEDEDEVPEF